MGRRASIIITHVTLQNTSFEATTHVLYEFLDAVSATVAPLIMAALYGSTYHLHLPYPRDSSFVLFVLILCALLLYIMTLLIHVQFRGDFGVLIDQSSSVGIDRDMDRDRDAETGYSKGNSRYQSNTNTNNMNHTSYIQLLIDTMNSDINVLKSIYSSSGSGSGGHDKPYIAV